MTAPLRVLVRTTGGAAAGYGHLRRCVSLGEALQGGRVEVLFLVRGGADPGRVRANITVSKSRNTSVEGTARLALAWRADAIVLDDYAFDDAAVAAVKARVGDRALVVLIDDLGGRSPRADLLINGTVGAEAFEYRTPSDTVRLLGSRFVLLRRRFAARPSRRIAPRVRRVLILAGGSDAGGFSRRALDAVREALPEARVDVIVGPYVPRAVRVWLGRSAGRAVTLHEAVDNPRPLMLRADLAVSAAGQTLYELAATATPTVTVVVAGNQRWNAEGLAARGCVLLAGAIDEPTVDDRLRDAIVQLASAAPLRRTLARRGRGVVDGRGAARVAVVLRRCALARGAQTPC